MKYTEARVKSKLLRYIQALIQEGHRVWTHTLSDRYQSGMPDRIIIFNGMTLYWECKATGRELRKLQAYEAKKIVEAGGVYEVVSMDEDGELTFERVEG